VRKTAKLWTSVTDFPAEIVPRDFWNTNATKSMTTFDFVILNSELSRWYERREGKKLNPSISVLISYKYYLWTGNHLRHTCGIGVWDCYRNPCARGRRWSQTLRAGKSSGLAQFVINYLLYKPNYLRQPFCYSTGKCAWISCAKLIWSPLSRKCMSNLNSSHVSSRKIMNEIEKIYKWRFKCNSE
jgi:hypothetical protein